MSNVSLVDSHRQFLALSTLRAARTTYPVLKEGLHMFLVRRRDGKLMSSKKHILYGRFFYNHEELVLPKKRFLDMSRSLMVFADTFDENCETFSLMLERRSLRRIYFCQNSSVESILPVVCSTLYLQSLSCAILHCFSNLRVLQHLRFESSI